MYMKKLILALCLWCYPCLATDIKVVDGDSLEMDGNRIRLDGIDAPEFFQTCETAYGETYDCGQEATEFLRSFIADKQIRCDCDDHPDKYNRLICECFADKTSLNQEMVRQGWARVYRSKKYIDDENFAEENLSGIWQGRHMRPALYRILQKYQTL